MPKSRLPILRTKLLAMTAMSMLLATTLAVSGQKANRPWMEMPRKDAERLLANSPWSQTQVDTDASEMFYSPTRPGTASVGQPTSRGTVGTQQSINNNRADRGALNEEVHISYRICFLSARPVRQALARMILATQRDQNDQLVKQLQAFVERDFSPYIVIAVTVDSNDQRFSGPVMQAINSATTGTLRNMTYLERDDGKRLFLTEYLPPISDGLGAKFIFQRVNDGEPFLQSKNGTVRFFSQFNDSFKLNMQYKVGDMVFEQKLEY